MRVQLLLLFSLFVTVQSYRSRRLRRQDVPSEHVHVYAMESGINSEGGTVVDSGENRIDYTERDMNGSMWSDHSLLRLNEMDTSSNASADRAEAFFNLQSSQIHSQGNKADLYIVTQRATTGFSYTEHGVYGGANFSYDDGLMKVQGIGGVRATLQAETWLNDVPRSVSFEAETLPNGERELRLEAIDKPYHAVICFVGAMVYFQYAGHYVKMDPSYKFIEIWTDKYTITVKTEQAPFNVTMDRNEIVVLLKAENTRVCVYVNGVAIQAGQLTKNGGELSISGRPVRADGVMITALKTDLEMSNEGKVNSDTSNSFIMIDTNNHKVGLTARHHNLKINDGIPHIILDPGMSVVEITTNHGTFELSALMGPFIPPADKFSDIGPFQNQGHGGYGPPPNMAPSLSAAPPPPMPTPPIEEALPAPIPISLHGPPGMDIPPPPEAVPPLPPVPSGLPPGLEMLGAGFAADLPPPKANNTKNIIDDTETVKNKTVVTSITETSNDKLNVSNATAKANKARIPLDLLKAGFAADLPQLNKNGTNHRHGQNSTKSIDDTDTITKVDEKNTITDTFRNSKKGKVDPNVMNDMATDIPPITMTATTPASTTAITTTTTTPETTTTPTTTTTTTTPPTTTTTTTTSTTTTTTTTIPTTTTTLSPMEELKKLKEEMMKREKQYREWQEEQTSNDHDGDEHVEEFTYPNGTTVHRVVKTRRKITTTVIHRHREEIKETAANGTSKAVEKSSVSISSSTVQPLTTILGRGPISSSGRTRRPLRKTEIKVTLAPGQTLPPIAPL